MAHHVETTAEGQRRRAGIRWLQYARLVTGLTVILAVASLAPSLFVTTTQAAGSKPKPVTPLLPPLTQAARPAAAPPSRGVPQTSVTNAVPARQIATPTATAVGSNRVTLRQAVATAPTALTNPPPSAVTFPDPFSKLYYQPVAKPEYPGNPRRDIRGLYLTLYTAASTKSLNDVLQIVDGTSLNALVIDVKDDSGRTLHHSAAADRYNPKANEKAPVKDLAAFVKRLRDRKIYAIARIVTFKDPIYAAAHPERAIVYRANGKIYRSRDGLAWGSPYDPEYRAYNLAVAKEAALAGFNEIQFDYVRFPEIAKDSAMNYRDRGRQTKSQAIQSFLFAARRELGPLNVYVSADVFGLISATKDDMRIGQYWEAISNATDFISPMAYPSHYAPGTYGLSVPDLYPYELMSRTTRDALKRNRNIATPAEIRPWIQAFTAKWLRQYKHYGVPEIKAQIKALKENGIDSYLVWNPNNRYGEQAAAFK